jgi:hypothetical protein
VNRPDQLSPLGVAVPRMPRPVLLAGARPNVATIAHTAARTAAASPSIAPPPGALCALLRAAAEKVRKRGLRRVAFRVPFVQPGRSPTWCEAVLRWLPSEPAARLVVCALDGVPLVRSRLDDWCTPDDSPPSHWPASAADDWSAGGAT